MASIHEHPFLQELKSGRLNPHIFSSYIEQDAFYLIHYAKALALLAARSVDTHHIEAFLDFSHGALIAEREGIHDHFQKTLGCAPTGKRTVACLAYVHFLRSVCALDSLEEGAAAVLPCFWIYQEVGKALLYEDMNLKENIYLPWIQTYGGEAFAAGVTRACHVVDQLADQAAPTTRLAMEQAFLISAQLEWHFWDDAYAGRWVGSQ